MPLNKQVFCCPINKTVPKVLYGAIHNISFAISSIKHFRHYLDTSNLMDVFEAMLPIPK